MSGYEAACDILNSAMQRLVGFLGGSGEEAVMNDIRVPARSGRHCRG
jgi:hypothetical protein